MDALTRLAAEIPNLSQGQLIAVLVACLVLLIVLAAPPFMVLFSRRTSGASKFWWFVLTGTFSWLAYVPFLLMTRKPGAAGEQRPGGGTPA